MQSVEHRKPCELCLKIKFDEVKDDPSAVACSRCEKPFHLSCLGVDNWQQALADVHSFACHNCGNSEFTYGHLHLPLFSPGETCFKNNIAEFVSRKDFSRPQELPLKVLSGETEADTLTINLLEEEKFQKPILVKSKQFLGIKIPDNLDRKLLESQLGTLRQILVSNTSSQTSVTTYLHKFNNHFYDPACDPVLCSLSLELSRTKLSTKFNAPKVVKSVDWSIKFYKKGELKTFTEKFLQQCMAGSFVTFHVEGGGSSFWHHIYRVKEVLYLIEPKEIRRFARHIATKNRPWSFFEGEMTPPMQCYRIEVEEGQTVFIPGGFIRASYYPVRTVIFGGNFLNIYNADIQLRWFKIEQDLQFPKIYMFPDFKKLHWCLARGISIKTGSPVFSGHDQSLIKIWKELANWVDDENNEFPYVTPSAAEVLENFMDSIDEYEDLEGAEGAEDAEIAESQDDSTATGGEQSGIGFSGSSCEAGEIAEFFKMSPSLVYPSNPKRLFRLVPYSDSEDEESDN